MRAKTEYGQQPERFAVLEGRRALVLLRENIEEIPAAEEGENARWQADEYQMLLPWSANLAERVANNFDTFLASAKAKDAEEYAKAVREARDKMLAESDERMALDRIGLDVPSGTTFTAWLAFLKAMGEAISGAWSVYRQKLRDVPQQAGFPYTVDWPVKPDA